MDKVEMIISSSLKEINLWEHFQEQRLICEWKQVVGSTIAHNVKILEINPPVIQVGVFNSAWMQQINMQKYQILQKINNFYGKNLITDLKYKMYGQQPGTSDVTKYDTNLYFSPAREEKLDLNQVQLTVEEVSFIDKEVAKLSDSHLADVFRKTMINQFKHRRIMSERGQKYCLDCGKPIANDKKICLGCQYRRYGNLIGYLIKLIKKYPRYNYEEFCLLPDEEIIQLMPYFKQIDYDKAKKETLYFYLNNLYRGSIEINDLYQTVRLITRKEDSELTKEYVINMTNKYRPIWVLEELREKYNWPVSEKTLEEKQKNKYNSKDGEF